MASHYARGAARERQLKERLEGQGWVVQRSAGSKGCADLVAMRRGELWFLEVKTTPQPYASFGPEKRRAMKEAAEKAGAQAILAHWPPNKVCRWLPSDGWPS
jgi:Holliday junction resolvase